MIKHLNLYLQPIYLINLDSKEIVVTNNYRVKARSYVSRYICDAKKQQLHSKELFDVKHYIMYLGISCHDNIEIPIHSIDIQFDL